LGLGTSRNIGIDNAKGDYVVFCDGDDYLQLDALECMQHYISYHKSLNVLSFESVSLVGTKLIKRELLRDHFKSYELTNANLNHNIFKKASTS
jgi:glycosyltransferase involved in cell wall biosynthesis